MSEESSTEAAVASGDIEETPVAKVPDDGTPIVLVTGASGYISSHVVKQLLEEGKYRVRGTVRNTKNEEKVKPVMELVPNPTRPLELVEADLTSENGWQDAVNGCTYVLHIASPFPSQQPKNEEELIRPAVDGTLHVLKACAESGTVKRVVLVSSIAAVSCGLLGDNDKIHTEEDWSDETRCPPYEKSKLKAERAGWDYVKKLDSSRSFEFCVVNPAAVIGPVLNSSSGKGSTSVSFILSVLANQTPSIPNVSIPFVDVRDVADGILAAMTKPVAAGQRYLLANETSTRYLDVANMIAEEFVPQGYKIPTKEMSNIMIWIGALFNPMAKQVKSIRGKNMKYNVSKAADELGITPRPMKDTVIDLCYSIIECGMLHKTPGYLGHPDSRPPPEEPKAEEPKAEEPKAEEPKAEEPKTEEPKAEEPKTEEPKAEEPKTEEPKAEETKAEETKAEEPKAEEPKTEETKAEEPKTEEPKAEEPKTEEPKTEEPKAEEPKAEEPKAEEPKAEEPKTDDA